MLDDIVHAPIEPVEALRSAVPDPVLDMVYQLLEKDPAKRPSDLAGVARRLGVLSRTYATRG